MASLLLHCSILLACLCLSVSPVQAQAAAVTPAASEETTLVNYLLSNYDRHVKPTLKASTPIYVAVGFGLSQIQGLSEVGETMTASGWLMATWQDQLLTWDPAQFGGIMRVVVPGSLVWLPEINLYNSVVAGNDFSLDSKFRVSIAYDGSVTWVPSMMWQTSCDMDMTYFPFDNQQCRVTIINWTYGKDQLFFVTIPGMETAFLQGYLNSSEWILDSTSVNTTVLEYNSGGQSLYLPTASMYVSLTRVGSFYVAAIMFPCIMLVLVSVMVFLLPPESGEKMALAITVLLSFTVVIVMVADVTPRTSNLPLFLWFVVISMALSGLSVICSIIVMNINHHGAHTGVPRWAKRFFLQKVAACLCIRHEQFMDDESEPADSDDKEHAAANQQMNASKESGASDIGKLHRLLKGLSDAKEKRMENEEEWQFLAIVIDRILFCIFGTIIIVYLAVMFLSLLALPRSANM